MSQVRQIGKVARFANPTNAYYLVDHTNEKHEYEPSLLDPLRFRDTPLKFNRPTGGLSPNLLTMIEKHIIDRLRASGMKAQMRLNFDETVSLLDRETRAASPGYPFILKYATKQEMLEHERVSLNRDFLSDRASGYFHDFPKGDEFLKKLKRIRSINGMEFPLMLKMLSLTHVFNSTIKSNPLLPIMIGISTKKGGWQRIIDIKSRWNKAVALDATNHDSCLPQEVMDSVCRIRQHFLSHQVDRDLLGGLYEFIKTKNLVDLDGTVWTTNHGMPSGLITTAEDNSLSSWIFTLYCICEEFGFTLIEAEELLDFLFYGDDQVLGTSADLPQDFPERLQRKALHYGYVLKQAGWVKPHDADFLSKVERSVCGLLIPVTVRAKKLYESSHYTHKTLLFSPTDRILRLLQIRTELVGTEFFDAITEDIARYASEHPSEEVTQLLRKIPSEVQLAELISGAAFFQSGPANYQPDKIEEMEKQNKPVNSRKARKPKRQNKQVIAPKFQTNSVRIRTYKPKSEIKPLQRRAAVVKPVPPMLRPSASSKMKAFEEKSAEDTTSTAMAYMASLFNTSNSPPARFPDEAPLPTAVLASVSRFQGSANNDTGSGKSYIIFCLYPRLKNQLYAGVSTGGAIAWTVQWDDVNYGYLLTNASRYHCTGAEVKIRNLSPLMYEGGVLYSGNWTSQYGSIPSTVGAIQTNQSLQLVNLNDSKFSERSRTNWVPGDIMAQASFVEPDVFSGAVNEGGIIFLLDLGMSVGVQAVNASFLFEITYHWEFQPNAVGSTVTNPLSSAGDPGKIGAISLAVGAETTKSINDSNTTVWDKVVDYFGKTDVAQMVDDAVMVVGKAWSIASFAMSFLDPKEKAEFYIAVGKHLIQRQNYFESHHKGLAPLGADEDHMSPFYVPPVADFLPKDHPAAKHYNGKFPAVAHVFKHSPLCLTTGTETASDLDDDDFKTAPKPPLSSKNKSQ